MRYYLLIIFMPIFLLAGCSKPLPEKIGARQSSIGTLESIKPFKTESVGSLSIDISKAISIPIESRPYITVTIVHMQTATVTVPAPARVEFHTKALSKVGTVVAGRLGRVNVQTGDRVKAGAVLATLESPAVAEMRADVIRAKAELQRAEDRAKRQATMQKSGVGLEIERVEANTLLQQAQADYQRSQQAVRVLGGGSDQSIFLRAPSDGVVLHVNASLGATVEAGAMLFELGEPGALRIVADVFDNDLPLIKVGAKATINFNGLTEPVLGHITEISAQMQSDLRRGSVYIELEKANSGIKPGMFAKALIDAAGPNRIVLPTTAVLIKDKTKTLVYKQVATGMFEPHNVVIGQARDGQVTILEGLSEGDQVVTSGTLLLDSAAAMLL